MTYPEQEQNGYDVIDSNKDTYPGFTNTISLLFPTGLQKYFSVKPGDIVGLNKNLRGQIRSIVTKFPYYFYSGFPTVALKPTFLVSYDNFMLYCYNNIWQNNQKAIDKWNKYAADYEWKDGVPKANLFIRENPEISAADRAFIMNGIRSSLSSKDVIYSRVELADSVKSLTLVFSIFVTIVGIIALFISFFLLLISATQNIHEAIWEYGVLRSMGLTKDEGRRLYMYEAFTIVGSASLLGTCIGVLSALLISNQLLTFIEMPLSLNIPWLTLSGMFLMAAVTTYIAVSRPMSKVNKKQIASVLKTGDA